MDAAGAGAGASPRVRVTLLAIVVAAVAIVVALVALTLRRPEVPTYAPTPAMPRDVGPAMAGPIVYTVDARAQDRWTYFSFRLGAAVDAPGPRDWDLAFRRFQIIANGGPGYLGGGGIRDLGPVAFATVATVPADGYVVTEGDQDPSNAAIARWYGYGFFSHVLTPKPHVWAVRTADGRYAKMELVAYYCAGGQPGCPTFRYVYQGNGSTVVAEPHADRRADCAVPVAPVSYRPGRLPTSRHPVERRA